MFISAETESIWNPFCALVSLRLPQCDDPLILSSEFLLHHSHMAGSFIIVHLERAENTQQPHWLLIKLLVCPSFTSYSKLRKTIFDICCTHKNSTRSFCLWGEGCWMFAGASGSLWASFSTRQSDFHPSLLLGDLTGGDCSKVRHSWVLKDNSSELRLFHGFCLRGFTI